MIAAVLDAGLDRFTTRDLVERLGVTAAAIHRRFGTRNDIEVLVGEHLAANFMAPTPDGRTSEALLIDLAVTLRRYLLEHPGLGLYLLHLGPTSIETIRMIDRFDQGLVTTGLDVTTAVVVAGSVASFTVGMVEVERAAAATIVDGQIHRGFRDGIAGIAHELPILSQVVGMVGGADPDERFAWLARCFVTGLLADPPHPTPSPTPSHPTSREDTP